MDRLAGELGLRVMALIAACAAFAPSCWADDAAVLAEILKTGQGRLALADWSDPGYLIGPDRETAARLFGEALPGPDSWDHVDARFDVLFRYGLWDQAAGLLPRVAVSLNEGPGAKEPLVRGDRLAKIVIADPGNPAIKKAVREWASRYADQMLDHPFSYRLRGEYGPEDHQGIALSLVLTGERDWFDEIERRCKAAIDAFEKKYPYRRDPLVGVDGKPIEGGAKITYLKDRPTSSQRGENRVCRAMAGLRSKYADGITKDLLRINGLGGQDKAIGLAKMYLGTGNKDVVYPAMWAAVELRKGFDRVAIGNAMRLALAELVEGMKDPAELRSLRLAVSEFVVQHGGGLRPDELKQFAADYKAEWDSDLPDWIRVRPAP